MKVIDEKGRLFGKINIIDFSVIVFLFCLLPVFYFGYKIFTKKTVEVKKESVRVEIKCQLIKLRPEVLEAISVGDKELDENGEVIGEIISLGQSGPYKYEFDIGGQKLIQEDAILKQMEAKLKLIAKLKDGQLYYKNNQIKIGSPLEFKTDKYNFIAIPLKEKEEKLEGRAIDLFLALVEIDCQLIKLRPEVLEAISVGDKELDENGEVIGEIISLGQSGPYKYEFDIGGQKIFEKDAKLRQLEAKLKLIAKLKDGQLYYKNNQIKIGSPLEFKTDKYNFIAIPFKEVIVKIIEREIDLYVTLKDLDEDTLKKISVGDKEVDESGLTIAEIISLGKIENSSLEFDLGGGNFVMGEDSSKKQISTKMRLRCQVKDGNQLYFKGKKVSSNTFLEFKTDKYKVRGLVAKTFEITSPIKEKWMSLQVKFSGIVPEIARVVQKGDIEKDAFERTVARINSIISNEPSKVLTLEEGAFITLNHPFNKDILASLNVLCVEKEGIYYYKNYPVKMGNNIVFTTDLYSISGLIVGMEMK